MRTARRSTPGLDGELDPDTQIELEQHLSECGPCRVHRSFAAAFKADVRDAHRGLAAPEVLAARIRGALDAEDDRREAPAAGLQRPPLGLGGIRLVPLRARYAVPAAAAAVALAVIAAQEGAGTEEEGRPLASASATGASMFEEIVRRHAREHPVEVEGEPTQVERWLQDKLEFAVRPVSFSSPDARLVGARLSNVSDREAAALYYTVNGRRVTVMVFEPPSALDQLAARTRVRGRGMYYGRAHGYTVPVVEYNGLSYAFTGDLDSRSLMQLAATARLGR